MRDNFAKSLILVLGHEGGYVNHPMDPGGATNLGVTQRVFDAYRKKLGVKVLSVRFITQLEAAAIYRSSYWTAIRGDELPVGVDYVTFDYAVNSGPSKAIKHLQEALGLQVDGVMGPITMRAVSEADPKALIEKIIRLRTSFLQRLKNWAVFGKGWGRRVAEVRQGALAMLNQAKP